MSFPKRLKNRTKASAIDWGSFLSWAKVFQGSGRSRLPPRSGSRVPGGLFQVEGHLGNFSPVISSNPERREIARYTEKLPKGVRASRENWAVEIPPFLLIKYDISSIRRDSSGENKSSSPQAPSPLAGERWGEGDRKERCGRVEAMTKEVRTAGREKEGPSQALLFRLSSSRPFTRPLHPGQRFLHPRPWAFSSTGRVSGPPGLHRSLRGRRLSLRSARGYALGRLSSVLTGDSYTCTREP